MRNDNSEARWRATAVRASPFLDAILLRGLLLKRGHESAKGSVGDVRARPDFHGLQFAFADQASCLSTFVEEGPHLEAVLELVLS
jgi:hypothetical protein